MTRINREARLAGLTHPDLFVRSACLVWFHDHLDPGVEVTREVLTSIEAHGWENAFEFSNLATCLQHDGDTVDRLLSLLEQEEPTEDKLIDSYHQSQLSWLLEAPHAILAEREGRLLRLKEKNAFHGDIDSLLEILRVRSRYRSLDSKSLRHIFEETIESCTGSSQFPTTEVDAIQDMIPVLIETGAVTREEVEEWVRFVPDAEIVDAGAEFRLGIGLMMAKEFPFLPPIDSLLGLLTLDWEWVSEQVERLLVRTASSDSFSQLVTRYPSLAPVDRLTVIYTFAQVELPQLEDWVCLLLGKEAEANLRAQLGRTLAAMGTAVSMARAYEVYREDPSDPDRSEIPRFLYAYRILLGGIDEETLEWGKWLEEDWKAGLAHAKTQEAWEANENPAFHYDPGIGPDPVLWGSLSDEEKQRAVADYVERFETHGDAGLSHAMTHVIVEDQVSLGDETPVAGVLHRLVNEGLNRHEAIHAIGSVLEKEVANLSSGGGQIDNDRYFEQLGDLTAVRWLARGWSELPPSPPAESRAAERRVAANDPCPCGSGKRYGDCCIRFAN